MFTCSLQTNKRMKKDEGKSRVASKASHTALMASIHRFMATKEVKEEFKGPDNLAYVFLPPKAKFFLSYAFFRRVFTNKLHEKVPGTYEYITARTKFFDEIFVQSLKERIPQIVFLGAGFDTRAIRFQHLTKDTLIYELDAPTTQEEKKKILQKHNIPHPGNLVFVPINFNTDNLEDTLLLSGYDPKRKTLFIWEGVTMYIPEKAVKDTLSFIKHNSGAESTLAFDYFFESVINGTCTSYGADKLAESASKLSEHFKFGIEEGKAQEFLDKNGFALINHITPNEFEEKYLQDNAGNQFGKMYGFAGHVYARLNGKTKSRQYGEQH